MLCPCIQITGPGEYEGHPVLTDYHLLIDHLMIKKENAPESVIHGWSVR